MPSIIKNINPKKNNILPQESDYLDNEKAQSARIFYEYYHKAKIHPEYIKQKQQFLMFLSDLSQ